MDEKYSFKDGLEELQRRFRKEEWDKIQEEERKKSVKEPEPTLKRITRPHEKVLDSTIKWKPIDRVAARMLTKVPWWERIVDIKEIRKEEIVEEPKKKKNRKHKNMSNGVQNSYHEINNGQGNPMIKIVPGAPDGGVMLNLNEVTVRIIDEINRHPQKWTPLARAAVDAGGVLKESMSLLGGVMEDFTSKSKIMLEDIRQTRFSMVSEVNHMTKELKEVRQFFLGSDYKEEISRLREFVELCERLQKLKSSGMLDAIGDTMIKLSN